MARPVKKPSHTFSHTSCQYDLAFLSYTPQKHGKSLLKSPQSRKPQSHKPTEKTTCQLHQENKCSTLDIIAVGVTFLTALPMEWRGDKTINIIVLTTAAPQT